MEATLQLYSWQMVNVRVCVCAVAAKVGGRLMMRLMMCLMCLCECASVRLSVHACVCAAPPSPVEKLRSGGMHDSLQLWNVGKLPLQLGESSNK